MINRWRFNSHKGWEGQAGVNVLTEDRQGGQIASETINQPYRFRMEDNRGEIWGKTGYVFPQANIEVLVFKDRHYTTDSEAHLAERCMILSKRADTSINISEHNWNLHP